MFYYYGFDWTYVILVLPCVLLSLIASSLVSSTFNRFSKIHSGRRITGAEAAQRVLRHNGVSGVRVERVSGKLTDHYDPKNNVIRLSDNVHDSTSVAAIGVACHEAGHAVQYAKNYSPIHIRATLVPITNIGTNLALPLILIGLLLTSLGYYSDIIVNVGIACFGLSFLFQVITLPVEFNASRRAMVAINEAGILSNEERKGARKTLTAAAMTYVAAAAVSLAQLVRLVLLFGGNRRRD